MLHSIFSFTLQEIFSEEWLNDILLNDLYLTDELIQNDIVIFDGSQTLYDINKMLYFIEKNNLLNIFFIGGNATLN